MMGMDCINQQARDRGLTKRSQAERLAIADSLIASVWEEYLNGSIDRGNLQLAVNIQINVNRIVWKLNELNNPNSPNISKALDALDCISRQDAIEAFDCTDELIIGGSANAQNVMNYINKVIGKIKALPSAQPSAQPEQCDYCIEDSDGYVKPIEKNSHAFVRFGMDGWELSLKAKGWHGSAKIRYCPMCGRDLFVKLGRKDEVSRNE